ncbi:ligase-associated DNA damage response exonuclease [Pseudochryseolinea flava]|uniref:Ligase-associated DNA damage response exonuclease n=1 Tax=Pseudochryseolinea flava TaxID=2059302 RepID=A0A364Y450_9BACT|nr:ligase-associated DNA damage response exonuclease [Pseudochryseolinea flava]RAW01730.1 ligase-associated DNA damage response exonuclease [Pseudochryseolinea flava]
MSLLTFTDRGIYCAKADVFLDPWKPVKRAIISHGHSDHASFGHGAYMCTTGTAPIIKHRLSLTDNVQALPYGEQVDIHGVKFSFHPAGHIPGSAQIRVEHQGEVWVFSGDYKRAPDHVSEPFEPARCHTFITESTFGLPFYRWQSQQDIMNDVNLWWRKNQSEGKVSVMAGYALGKSQRVLKNIDSSIGKIFTHGAIHVMNDVLMRAGMVLPETTRVTAEMKKQDFEGALILCPPSAVGSSWIRKFMPFSLGIASGWMLLRGARRRRGADRGFVLSDHADWNELNTTVHETGAERVFVTHGYAAVFAQWLREKGLDAHEVKTQFEGELGEIVEAASEEGVKTESQ